MLMLSFTSPGASFTASFSVSAGTVSFLMAMLGSPLKRLRATSQTIWPGGTSTRNTLYGEPVTASGGTAPAKGMVSTCWMRESRVISDPAGPITLRK